MISGNLFTRDYLLEGVTRSEPWKALSDKELATIEASLKKLAAKIQGINAANEAQTEKIFIYPALELLGWSDVEVQQTLSAKGRKHVPDALLFGDTDARDRAVGEKDQWKRYQHGLAVTEAKRWGRALDRTDKRDAHEEGVPSTQMLQYLDRVSIVTGGKVRLGILTNGAKWRLYYQGALSVSEDYFEVDLAKALQLPGHELDLVERSDAKLTPAHALKLFVLLFRKQAFLPLDGPRTFHDIARDEGKIWEAKVTRDLSRLVFQQLYPNLVAALHRCDHGKPMDIDARYLEDLRESALVLLYRLLFVVYAEDRDLLPKNQEPYKSYSLTSMRAEIAARVASLQPFSPTIAIYWPKLKAVFKAIAEGDDTLGIPPYNGGLFAKDSAPILDRVELPDAVLAELIYKLSHRPDDDGKSRYINYRDLTVQQLGTIYERTLEYGLRYEQDGDTVIVDADDTARHESGSYYTPDSLVSLIIERAVGPFIEERLQTFRTESAKLATDKRPLEARLALLQGYDPALAILELRICDPSMGSGHFLVNLVDWLADKALASIAEAELIVDWSDKPYRSPVLASIEQTRTDIIRQATVHKWPFVMEHLDDRHIVRRTVLKRCIYGVDKNPMAVELAKVALWLHTFTVGAPLSFLDHHLRCGNTLFGYWVREAMDRLAKWGGQLLINEPMQKAMAQALAMQKLERVNDIDIAEVHQSKTLFDGIEQETRPLNSFVKILYALEWLKLDKDDQSAVRSWLDGQYGDPFEIARGRFTLGPTDAGDGHAQPKDVLDQLRNGARASAPRFAGILNRARQIVRAEKFQNWQIAFPGVWTHWENAELQGGFHAVVGNPPYVRQELIKDYKPHLKTAYPDSYDGSADLYVYFYDQGLHLLKPGGRLSYVVTNKWMRANYADGLRGVFENKAWVEFVADFGHAKKFFPDADVFPSVIVIRKPMLGAAPSETEVCVIPRDDVPEKALDEAVARASYRLPRSHFTSRSWTLEPPDVVKLMEKIGGQAPLSELPGLRCYRGVTTGFNKAFIVDTKTRDRLIALDPNAKEIIKPFLRGQDVQRWTPKWAGLWIIFARRGIDITAYPSVEAHLRAYEQNLLSKPDGWKPKRAGEKWQGRKEGSYAWYELQDSTDYYSVFEGPKIIYQAIQFHPRYCFDDQQLYTSNKTFVISGADQSLLAILNSPLIWWYSWRHFIHMKDEALSNDGVKMETLPIAASALKDERILSAVHAIEAKSRLVSTAAHNLRDWLGTEFTVSGAKAGLANPDRLDLEGFVEAVKTNLPKGQRLTAADQAELKREYSATLEPIRVVSAEIFNLEKQISDLVNQAYGLTSAEVNLLWRTAPPRMPFTPTGLSSENGEEDNGEIDE
ncbi:Eco57I restriction-modification methylase domain-containing protein [Hyphomicrobium sp.]|uniref:Eco57I restriction-modification methylase domain-containing protein n=1 Tax=Hyphomicrobium sp. TaxID=82 RepID=UPI003565B8C1